MKRKIVTINGYNECVIRWVILLEIVMVIPVKYESLSRTNESQFKKRVQSSNCLDLSCIQTVNLKAESKTFYYIDNDEIPGFLQWSFTCEDIKVVMATSVSAHGKRASQHLAIDVYIINRILHAHLWIRVLSSLVQLDINQHNQKQLIPT